jgi:hypothetical protein
MPKPSAGWYRKTKEELHRPGCKPEEEAAPASLNRGVGGELLRLGTPGVMASSMSINRLTRGVLIAQPPLAPVFAFPCPLATLYPFGDGRHTARHENLFFHPPPSLV